MRKHRCEVIEVYPEEYKMAVRMLSGRVECVQRRDSAYSVGTKGYLPRIMRRVTRID